MSITERGEILTRLYKLSAECGALLAYCQDVRAVAVAVSVTEACDVLNEKIDEMQGRETAPRQLSFARF